MKKIITLSLSLLLVSGCSIVLKDERIDTEKLNSILSQQATVITAIVTELQAKGYLEKPKEKVKK